MPNTTLPLHNGYSISEPTLRISPAFKGKVRTIYGPNGCSVGFIENFEGIENLAAPVMGGEALRGALDTALHQLNRVKGWLQQRRQDNKWIDEKALQTVGRVLNMAIDDVNIALVAAPAPTLWTPDVKARCERKCGDVGDPACYHLPELTSDAPKDIQPCAECLGVQAQTGQPAPESYELVHKLADNDMRDGKLLFEQAARTVEAHVQERLAAAPVVAEALGKFVNACTRYDEDPESSLNCANYNIALCRASEALTTAPAQPSDNKGWDESLTSWEDCKNLEDVFRLLTKDYVGEDAVPSYLAYEALQRLWQLATSGNTGAQPDLAQIREDKV